MKCPACGSEDTIVVDSRSLYDGQMVKRRRVCRKCETRFSTGETLIKGSIKKPKIEKEKKILLG